MRRIIPAAGLLVSLALAGCAGTGTTGGATNAGPDTPTIAESIGSAASTLAARVKSGLAWMWATYTRLDKAGAVPGLADLKADIVDIEAAAGKGDLLAALDLWQRARARVTAIVAAMGQ